MNLSYFFLGYVTVSVDYENITSLLNLCMYYCLPYSEFKTYDDCVKMNFRLSVFQKMREYADSRGIIYTVEKRRGLPCILERYKYRFGIFLGALSAAVLIFVSYMFVWDIDVTGNTTITSSEVKKLLREYGFSTGAYIPNANTDKIENQILIASERISWMSINIIGTVAYVEVREYEAPKSDEVSSRPANLIASKSGLVEEVRIWRGQVMTAAGKYVNKGELLVSGLYDSTQVGFRYTRASGEVFARTVNEFYIEIPFEYEENVYTGEEYCDKYLNFFDYSINISKKCGKEGALYDKISIIENCSLPGGAQTPFSFTSVKYLEYEKVKNKRTADQAERLAYFELEQKLSEMADGSIMISKSVTPSVHEDRYSLYCVVVLIENIAQTSEFDIDLEESGKYEER